MTQRNRETLLRSIQYTGGKNAFHRPLEKVLGGFSFELQFRWKSCGKLDQLMVEERFASLDRMGHAHSVHFRENVIGQVILDVEILKGRQPVDPVSRWGLPHDRHVMLLNFS